MKVQFHDVVIPLRDGAPEQVTVCMNEIDSLGRAMPYVRVRVNLKPAEQAAIDDIRQRAKRILIRRTDAAVAAVAADPAVTPSLDVPVDGEDAE